jgi:hypothetical protein
VAVYSFTSVLLKAPMRLSRPAAFENSASQINTPNHRLGHRQLGAYRPRRKPIDTMCICYRRIHVNRALFEPLCSCVSHDSQTFPSLLFGSSELHCASLSSRFPAP